jgi:hypothetical protein
MAVQITDKPVRMELYDTIAEAERAVENLQRAGFEKERIGVMCSEKCKDRFFSELPQSVQSGTPPGISAAAGGAIGATIGGLTLAATSILTGGVPLLAAGMVLIGGGAIAGTFAGTMASFGYDREISEEYDKALQEGKILVTVQAVEVPDEHNIQRVAVAERILADAKRR